MVEFDGKADARPLHETIALIQKNNPEKLRSVADNWLLCALAERDPVTAEKAAAALGENFVGDGDVGLSRQFMEGVIARMTKDDAKARMAFAAARVEQEKTVQPSRITAQPSAFRA